MKRIFLLSLASSLMVCSFAAGNGKLKIKKSKKSQKTEQVCPPTCAQTGCGKM